MEKNYFELSKHNEDNDSEEGCSPLQKLSRFFGKTKRKRAKKYPKVN